MADGLAWMTVASMVGHLVAYLVETRAERRGFSMAVEMVDWKVVSMVAHLAEEMVASMAGN